MVDGSPAWVAVLVGVVGVGGVVLGQWLSARRDDARWLRESGRDRERQQVEAKERWTQRWIEAALDFVVYVEETRIRAITSVNNTYREDWDHATYESNRAESYPIFERVCLVAPERVVESATLAWHSLMMLELDAMTRTMLPGSLWGHSDPAEDWPQNLNLYEALTAFRSAVRSCAGWNGHADDVVRAGGLEAPSEDR